MGYLESIAKKASIITSLPLLLIPILAIIIAELLNYQGKTKEVMLAYALLLLAFSVLITTSKNKELRQLYQAFLLLPILRLVGFSMPIFLDSALYSSIFIYAPLAIPVIMVFMDRKIPCEKKETTLKNLVLYLPFSLLAGFFLGSGEYALLREEPLVPSLSFINILQLLIIMVFFVALIEELIFRSILQTALESFFGAAGGIFFASLLFGFMHSGYGNPYEILYAFFVGLFIGAIYHTTESIFLVTLIHSFLNVFLFGIIPYLGFFS
jgi:membrane protease YdiL (CAAX protease family)